MFFLSLLLVIIAASDANLVDLGYGLGVASQDQNDVSSSLDAISIRARDPRKQRISLTIQEPKPLSGAAPNIVTLNTVPLISRPGVSLSQKYVQFLDSSEVTVGNGTIKNYQDQVYLTAIKFGNQQFYSVIDTGSSDTWIIDAGFRCTIPRTAQPGPNNCGFGPGYKKTSTFSQNKPAQKFSISYSGEHVEGIAGTETVTFGNIPVLNQQVAVVNSGVWKGDGISSGLIGLAFPSNSAVWTEMAASREPYSPIFTSMYRKGLVAPYFSIALNRGNESPGVLALGGLPGAPIRYSNKFARAPFQYLTFGDSDPSKKPAGDFDYRLYRITIDGFSVNAQPSSVDKKRAQVSVDSGTAVLVLPSDVAKAFNAGWKPAAQYDRIQGWRVECTAKPPKFGVKLNGTTFWIDGMDLVVPREPGAPGSLCSSGVQEAKWPGGAMLGSIFLKNVLAVFDIGAAELRFADRLR